MKKVVDGVDGTGKWAPFSACSHTISSSSWMLMDLEASSNSVLYPIRKIMNNFARHPIAVSAKVAVNCDLLLFS